MTKSGFWGHIEVVPVFLVLNYWMDGREALKKFDICIMYYLAVVWAASKLAST